MVHGSNAHNVENMAMMRKFVEGVLICELDECDIGLCKTGNACKKSIESSAK
jgi:hypothetical protein